MDLNKIKERLQAAKKTSERKHYKIAISELVGVLIDLVDEIQATTAVLETRETTMPDDHQKVIDEHKAGPIKYTKTIEPQKPDYYHNLE